ncbi:SpoIIE family protein phosphatase [Streptomyces sp. NPDC048664]|uniref:SpoIIE family protein phosphatase n=1 Tax=Streptomyces sp. NPDC048664 TaxID=3154505 RepID=UPI003443B5C3
MADGTGVPAASDTGTAILDALFTRSPVGLAVLDTELRVLRVNTAAPPLQGLREEDLVGRRFPRAHHVAEPEKIEALLRAVLSDGVPMRERIVRARPPVYHGNEHVYEVSAFRLEEPLGTVLGVALTVVDVTDRERGRTRLAALDGVRQHVGRTLDVVATCQELVDALVPAFADVAVVEVVDAVIRGDEPPLAPLPRDARLRRAAFRSGDGEGRPQAHPVGDVRALPGPTPYSQALTDLRPRAVGLRPSLPWLTADPPRARAIRESGVHALLAVPLDLRGTVLGLLSLYRSRTPGTYDEADIELARDVARHTALCVDNARRYTRDHTVAATVLRHMLPLHPASHTALEADGIARPGGGGSGWYDTIALSGARTALVAGSVCGEGIAATATVGQLRTVVHALASLDLDPEELLARLNDTASLLAAERADLPPANPLHREPSCAHCVYAVYDPLTRICTAARAGYPAPVVVRPDGTVESPDTPAGPALGSADLSPFAADCIALPLGSTIAFPGSSALAGYLRGTRSPLCRESEGAPPVHDLCDDILYGLPAAIQDGDVVLVLARTRCFPSDRVATLALDDTPAAVAAAREYTRDRLAAWEVGEETAMNAELIVSELATNALRYGSPPLELRLILDRGLTCEVSDGRDTAPHLRHARTTDEGGRGLFIVAQLAQTWGTRYSPVGKTVWTELALSPS